MSCFTKIFSHSHSDLRKPLKNKALRGFAPNTLYTVNPKEWVRHPLLPLFRLPYPTLPFSEFYFTFILHFYIYKICKPPPLRKSGSARPTSSRQILGDTHCRNFVSFVSQFLRDNYFLLLSLKKLFRKFYFPK